MPFNGSGVFERLYNWISDTLVSQLASHLDNETQGIADGLTNCITRDGQSPPTSDLPMGGFRLKDVGASVGDAVSRGESLDALVFPASGTGAVDRSALDKARETISVCDYGAIGDGVADDTAAIQAAVDILKAIGGGSLILPGGTYKISDTIRVYGSFGYRSIRIAGYNAEIVSTHAGSAIEFDPSSGTPAPQVKQRSELDGVSFAGPGRTTAGSVGISITNGATVRVRNCKVRGYEKGLSVVGGLILRFLELELYNNGYGFHFTSTDHFAPNDIHFQSCFIFENTRIGFAENFTYGCITLNECECEGNNVGGGLSDGVTILEFHQAGKVNLIGCHFEGNPGQKHILFDGGIGVSSLNIIGGEFIPGDNTNNVIEMAGVGHLHIMGARVTNNVAGQQQVLMGSGLSACVIGETGGYIGGDISKVVLIRNGKIGTGVLLPPANAAMRSKGTSGIAHDFEGQLRMVDASNNRLGYIGTGTGSVFGIANDQDNLGLQFNTRIGGIAAARFHIARLGTAAIEPGADNTISCGSPPLRFSVVYAGTGTINTSDAREKQQIRPLSDAERAVALRCKALVRTFKFNDAVAEKGNLARIHFGVIAQDVMDAFAAEGLDATQYALLCHDNWHDQIETNEDGSTTVVQAGGDRYGIRYEQLLAFIVAAL